MSREVMQQALEALEAIWEGGLENYPDTLHENVMDAIRAALAEPEQPCPYIRGTREGTHWCALAEQRTEPEQVEVMPSSTRYTVEVEGHVRTYWDNIHDAITNAQRAVYATVDATTRAIDDLQAGRMAEWSYGFSAVRIYPPMRAAHGIKQEEA